MKNCYISDYTVNKYSDGIVYRFVDQTVVIISRECFLRENPDKTAGDFTSLKAISDEIYAEQAWIERRQARRSVPLYGYEQVIDRFQCDDSTQNIVIDEIICAETDRRRYALAKQALSVLTDTQRRRYLLYHAADLTMREIGQKEDVHFTRIAKSIKDAEKKIKKYFSKT